MAAADARALPVGPAGRGAGDLHAGAGRALDELGLAPGEELREFQAAILRHDEAAAPAPARPRGGAIEPAGARCRRCSDASASLRSSREPLRLGDVRPRDAHRRGRVGQDALALEARPAMVDEFANGVFFVELAPLRDVALVPAAIAGRSRASDPGTRSARGCIAATRSCSS